MVTVKQCSKQWEVTTTSVPVKKLITDQDIDRGNEK